MLLVADTLASGSGHPEINWHVLTVPVQNQPFARESGIFRPTVAPWPIGITNRTGFYSFQLPWPSEADDGISEWMIQVADSVVWQGTVPEGVLGPVSVRDLRLTYGWHHGSIEAFNDLYF